MDAEERAENAKRKYLARGPGDAATKAYIASKYLGGIGDEETAKKKKKKKKVKSSIQKGNLGIVDEEDMGWRQVGQTEEDEKRKARRQYEREMQDLAAENSGGVFHGRRDGWHTIQGGSDQDDEDTSRLRGQDDDDIDERPVIVSEGMEFDEETIGAALRAGEGKSPKPKARLPRSFAGEDMQRDTAETPGHATPTTTANTKSGSDVSSIPGDETSERGGAAPKMSSGQRAGLLTGDALKQEVARAREAEKQALERLKEHAGKDAETVYRDATGRKIDPKIKKAEEERARKEANEQAAQRMEWGKGLVQRSEAEAKRRQLEEEKHKPMAR